MTDSGAAARNPYRQALRGLLRPLAGAAAFSAAVNLLMLTGPVYMLQVYDRVLSSGSVPTLVGLFAIVVVLYAFQGFYDFLRGRILSRAGYRLDAAVGPAAFRHWLAAGRAGGAATEARGQPLRDLDTVRGFLSGPAASGLMDAPWIPLYLGVVWLIHPWLGMLTLAGTAVVAVLAWINQAATRASIAAAMGMEGAERQFTEAARRQAEAIAALGMGDRAAARWRALHGAALARAQEGGDRSEGFAAASKAFRMLLQSALLTLGAWLALGQEISAGMIVAASIIAGRARAPADQIIGQWRAIGRGIEAHRRLLASFDALPAEPARIDLPAPTGAVAVARLTKLAPGPGPAADRARILQGVSFRLEPGDGLGVIGNSAAGKSTLARLLVGAWTPDAGEIRLDGATPDQWQPAALGRHVGYLPQALDLLPGTIRDNIARFDPAGEDAAVIAAARAAGVHEMILRLPDGYATRVGGAETPLSGGQLQRVGLARLVVLDEPNSTLDATGDEALAAAIAAIRARGGVVVVMAHRPSAIAAVNKLMILHAGQVAQFGPRDEVLAAATRPVPAVQPAPETAPGTAPPPAAAMATAAPGAAGRAAEGAAEGAAEDAAAAGAAPRPPRVAAGAGPVPLFRAARGRR
jgi:PrtD family type I secretion system ABC transporter